MAMADSDPTVRAQELGAAMRELREEAGFTVRAAGERIDVSASKISRIETGKNAIAVEEIAALLAVYEVTGPRRAKLIALAREADQRGWWQRSAPTFAERQETLISLESRALMITNFELIAIPGLLQTGEYTRAIMVESGLIEDGDVEKRMVTRLQRQSVLMRRQPPGLVAIIDEFALRRVIGGRAVQRRQLEHLVVMAQRPNIVIHVVPNDDRGHAAIAGGFTVLRRPEGGPVVFLGNHTSSLFLEEPPEVLQYEEVTRQVLLRALGPAESAEYIAEQATLLDTGEPRENPSQRADLG
ncbi:helix-turn-helix domain-containing protein [Amycolatopsis sp. NPDC059027]|uniref:helix-turn-helix domain-containing protein n=1 Tax=Amycolatopsis sp. NPDC059027 TaxID=3346709 RepID=UPI00366DB112